MFQFLIRGVTGAAIGYTLPICVLFVAFVWLGIFGINPPPATIKSWGMFLTSHSTANVGAFAGCVVGLASAARHRHLTKRSN
ncbi:MAG: hypothetical protein QM501_06090 [Gimesia sp.]